MIGITGGNGVLGKCFQDIIKKEHKEYELSIFNGDITKKSDLRIWINDNNFEAIIHLAAIVPIDKVNFNIGKSWKVNVLGSLYLTEVLKKTQKRIRLIYASSSHVYKKTNKILTEESELGPNNFYGLSKLQSEQILSMSTEFSKIELIIARIFSFASIYQEPPFFIPTLINKLITTPPKGKVTMQSLNTYRQFLDGHDVAKALICLMNSDMNGIVNICSEREYFLRDVFTKAKKLLGRKDIILHEKKPIKNNYFKLLGNNSKLKALGFRQELDTIDKILMKYINYKIKY